MIIAPTAHDLAAATKSSRRQERPIALVPTMGALHRGHTSLFDAAQQYSAFVVASIFVNPLQFGDSADLRAYPSTPEADLDLCRRHGVDVVYAPEAAAMYPSDFSTTVHIDGLTEIFEGAFRPGHFDGVTTVVAKLFNACRPDIAVFGQKDFQQAAVIRRLITDLDLPIELVVAPTQRDDDGLALSSRNVRLNPQSRLQATNLWRGLTRAHEQYRSGERDSRLLEDTVRRTCTVPYVELDYVAVVDCETLKGKPLADDASVILLAAMVDGVRLIDNVLLGS